MVPIDQENLLKALAGVYYPDHGVRESRTSNHERHPMTTQSSPVLHVNGRSYRWMSGPTVVVCVDGCEYDYITAAVQAGVVPYFQEMITSGNAYVADCVMP